LPGFEDNIPPIEAHCNEFWLAILRLPTGFLYFVPAQRILGVGQRRIIPYYGKCFEVTMEYLIALPSLPGRSPAF
jgi:hypothetical protein